MSLSVCEVRSGMSAAMRDDDREDQRFRDSVERPERAAVETSARLVALARAGDPLVRADLRAGRLCSAGRRSSQTFCGAGVPKIPDGRRRRNAIRIANTITSWYADETYPTANARPRPIASPPIIAPGMLPMPPTTAAVNAINPTWKPT